MALSIRPSDRVAFIGKTGSGKTYAARLLALPIDRLVVLDPKGTLKGKWGLREWGTRTRRDLAKGKPVRVRFAAPIGDEEQIAAFYDQVFKLCYEAGHVTVYIDEVYGVLSKSGRPGPWLTALYTRGRELGIGVWAATQRPAWVPRFILSETEWFLVFRLQLADDRKRVEEIIGTDIGDLQQHQFVLYNAEWDSPKRFDSIASA